MTYRTNLAAVTLIAALICTGCSGSGAGQPATAESSTVSTATAVAATDEASTPSATAEPNRQPITPIEQHADKDVVAKALFDRLNAWIREGSTAANQESYYTRPEPWEKAEFEKYAEDTAPLYIDTLFATGGIKNEYTHQFIDVMKGIHTQTLFLNLGTGPFSSDPDNVEAYKRENIPTRVFNDEQREDGSRSFYAEFIVDQNHEFNTAEEVYEDLPDCDCDRFGWPR